MKVRCDMNILFIANCVAVYGANRSMVNLAGALQKQGCNVFLFLPCDGAVKERCMFISILKENNIQYKVLKYYPSVHRTKERSISKRIQRSKVNRKCLEQMKKYVRKWKIDIIHTNSLTHTIGAELACKENIPHVWHIREGLKADYDLTYDNVFNHRRLLRKADRIICISKYVRQTHRRILRKTKTVTLYNGFAIKDYLLENVYDRKRDKYNLSICGVIREEKGQLDAVRAVKKLRDDYGITNIHLNIVGGGSGEYYQSIMDFIKKHRLDQCVSVLPFVEDLREVRANTDIALVCSDFEALGRVTIESMLSENVVIGAASAGTAEIIKDGVTGYLYNPGDIGDLCEKICHVIEKWDEQQRIIIAAKKYAVDNYDSTIYARRVLDIYKRILKKG